MLKKGMGRTEQEEVLLVFGIKAGGDHVRRTGDSQNHLQIKYNYKFSAENPIFSSKETN